MKDGITILEAMDNVDVQRIMRSSTLKNLRRQETHRAIVRNVRSMADSMATRSLTAVAKPKGNNT